MPNHVLLSTAYFPPISWIAIALQSKTVAIETRETYTKQTFRNRCNILGTNGLQVLSIPVEKPYGHQSKTCEIRISKNSDWRRIHLRSMLTAYNKSPFFLYYRQPIENLLFEPYELLIDLNISLLNLIFELLGTGTKLHLTNTFEKEPVGVVDMRNAINPGESILPGSSLPAYTQVFYPKFPFYPDLSILDLLFNEGPASSEYIDKVWRVLQKFLLLGTNQ